MRWSISTSRTKRIYRLKIKVNLLQDPTNVVINGAGTLLADKNTLSTLMHFDDK